MTSTNQVIHEETGVIVKYMRPPYGYYNSRVVRVSKELGLEVIMWNIDTKDWADLDGAYGIIEKELGWSESSIILMHDWTCISKYLQDIIDLGRSKGYEFVNMDECLEKDP